MSAATVTAKVQATVAKITKEISDFRHALVGPVAVLVALTGRGILPIWVEAPVLVVGSYLGVRPALKKRA